ncbi:hypothetical protein H5410_003764 [Solanum commersonii]|uniref:BHLH domain-containing protein n=1 Tax=Solanum commersonii TaxID=4109 RepID=A0A9J6B6J9_SOLCO|nr:hypothetical protein H5410_003764 [Solanum commersonii]
MNEGGGNDHDLYADVWSYLDLNDYQKEKSTQPKKNDKGIAEPMSGVDGGGGKGESEHEIHIWTERERRKKMRTLLETLHALVPNLPAKNTFKKLESQKLERLEVGNNWEKHVGDQGSTSNSTVITPTTHGASPLIPIGFMTWSSPNVILDVCGEDAHISVCCPKKPQLFTIICYVLEKHKIDILSAQVSSDQFRSKFMIQAHAKGGSGLAQFSEAFTSGRHVQASCN